jgi:hypothetical protein
MFEQRRAAHTEKYAGSGGSCWRFSSAYQRVGGIVVSLRHFLSISLCNYRPIERNASPLPPLLPPHATGGGRKPAPAEAGAIGPGRASLGAHPAFGKTGPAARRASVHLAAAMAIRARSGSSLPATAARARSVTSSAKAWADASRAHAYASPEKGCGPPSAAWPPTRASPDRLRCPERCGGPAPPRMRSPRFRDRGRWGRRGQRGLPH